MGQTCRQEVWMNLPLDNFTVKSILTKIQYSNKQFITYSNVTVSYFGTMYICTNHVANNE